MKDLLPEASHTEDMADLELCWASLDIRDFVGHTLVPFGPDMGVAELEH